MKAILNFNCVFYFFYPAMESVKWTIVMVFSKLPTYTINIDSFFPVQFPHLTKTGKEK